MLVDNPAWTAEYDRGVASGAMDAAGCYPPCFDPESTDPYDLGYAAGYGPEPA